MPRRRFILCASAIAVVLACTVAAAIRLPRLRRAETNLAAEVEVSGLSVPAEALAIGEVWEERAYV
jgi:hypothetical protein